MSKYYVVNEYGMAYVVQNVVRIILSFDQFSLIV